MVYGLYQYEKGVMLIMEYVSLGSLSGLLAKHENSLENSQLVNMCRQIALGMEYLHSKNILHNDLACRNVLVSHAEDQVDGHWLLKVSDFGLSLSLESNYYVYGEEGRIIPSTFMQFF